MAKAIPYVLPELLDEFDCDLINNISPIDIYTENTLSSLNFSKKLPYCLESFIQGFIEHWIKRESYIYDKCIVFNYNYCDNNLQDFSDTGCIVIFNCSTIDLILIKDREKNKRYDLPSGGLIVFEEDLRFKFITEKIDTRLKHLVILSFNKM